MSKDLNILAENRDALLLAEVAAWLHDMGKCRDEHIQMHAYDKTDNQSYDYKKHYASILNNKDFLDQEIKSKQKLDDKIYFVLVKDLIEKGKPNSLKIPEDNILIKLLGRCHAAAHIEKEEAKDEKTLKAEINKKNDLDKLIQKKKNAIVKKRTTINELEKKGIGDSSKINKLKDEIGSIENEILEFQKNADAISFKLRQVLQSKDNTWISTPFGYEYEKIENLNSRLKNIPFDKVNDRKEIIKSIQEAFVHALGETRRPTNEITLDDWSGIVAALYKSSLAGLLIEGESELDPRCLKWRFLSVRFNSEDIWGNSSSIPILLARKEWMETSLDNLKHLLEETYPLGNEVYRDENGSVFVVPYIEESEFNKALKDLIIEKMPYDGEIQVTPTVQDKSWCGQYYNYKKHPEKNEVPPISSIISGDIPSISANPNDVENWWKGKRCSICTVSHLRPADSRSSNRNISDYWLKKVTGRAKKWKEQKESTIWIDEVADLNGKICLLVGKLEISGWLKEDGYIKTLPFKSPDKDGDYKKFTKEQSFARISRVWRTTKKFWEEVKTNDLDKYRINKRIKVFAEFKPEESNKLQINNSYEAVSEDDIRFTIFYSGNNEYIIIENLELIAKKIKSKYRDTDKKAHELIKEYSRGRNIKIYDPNGKKRDKPLGSLQVSDVISEDANYVPVIPILAEPSIFMAIVPADKALDISRAIKKKYEEEMGKVRNRLPLTLGMVFAKSHTPISSIMDAGRRMLKNTSKEQRWEVKKSIEDKDPCTSNNKFHTLKFENGIEWKVPVTMRGGQIKDIWYPYFYIVEKEDEKPNGREKSFKGPDGWLVHASEIEDGDILRILPSTFDFEFLDSSSRRFEVYYDDDGKRWDKIKASRPYFLEDLDEFDKIWDTISNALSISQIKNIMHLLEAKREFWSVGVNDQVFQNYASDVLSNANWKKKPQDNDFAQVVDAAVSGKLKDIIELYMSVLKISENGQNDDGGI
ncbi:CRISPR-associated protein Csx11 [Methanosarcina barkeri]|uniref:CRISPR-associated protein Csx11 family n=1 Tax=Methanosarcina barkeri CM1 TaxID=796385 RepID=A0A0G3C9Y3_METBA|nr:CRISPR-associated protein Csx11 [Methanosarcina barkeri]AKJ38799.1 CRISPR-associated protein Csx11 family [Methanosarcina barkeri CM1]